MYLSASAVALTTWGAITNAHLFYLYLFILSSLVSRLWFVRFHDAEILYSVRYLKTTLFVTAYSRGGQTKTQNLDSDHSI